ncbi:MAG TPA: malectin domain-containing carbohydrate-binding protein [Candidatus Eremiobacteraceae bacterium]|nr:malectin domain-containing carbohydrate-binding protein [Candidatus Eremiobacteraceae bacterium]
MPSTAVESVSRPAERAELQVVLQSQLFSRSPTLSHLLSYLCEKTFAGQTEQIKEYSVALDVFDRHESFDQNTDSIVRVQANRLRKRLSEYYASEGAAHPIHIAVPVGQYIPVFERMAAREAPRELNSPLTPASMPRRWVSRQAWVFGGVLVILMALVVAAILSRERSEPQPVIRTSHFQQPSSEPPIGLPVGEEVRILAGANRKYIDHAGKLWSSDIYFSGGSAVASAVQHIWRTQDSIIYRSYRQGDFTYNIPLKPGIYEMHLHFAETFFGPENIGAGGEGSRIMTMLANGHPLLRDFDVLADSGGDRTAEVKVFSDISPAADGELHLSFSSASGGSAMLSAIEILPGFHGHIRPVRIVARDVPYYGNDSHWWSPDTYFKGGQLSTSQEPTTGTDDPEFYETERWGHFSYAIPVAPGRYTVNLYFIEHHARYEGGDRSPAPAGDSGIARQDRMFNVFSNGKTILANLSIAKQVGEDRPLVCKVKGLESNAQGKLLLEFVPVTRYATVTAIEVVPE